MADIVSSPPPPNIRKRPAPEDESPGKKPLNLKGSQFMMPTPPDTDQSSNVSPNASINNDEQERAASPAPSSISAMSSIVEVTSSNQVESTSSTAGPSTTPGSTTGPPPAKKRKLTPSEKLEKQRAKEIKEREKAEEKARKEEEKARKEEEKARKEEEKQKSKEEKDEKKRIKDEETRKKAEEREAKKREKELEEERKNQEKVKKERSQMRLGAFFQQKPTTPSKDADEYRGRSRRRSLSLEQYDDVADEIKKNASPMKGTPPPSSVKKPVATKSDVSDYRRTFLPFQLPTNSIMAPLPQFSEAAQDAFDREVQDPSLQEQYDLGIVSSYQGHADVEHYFAHERGVKRGMEYPKTRKLVDVIHGTSRQPIDLTNESTAENSMELLRRLPVRLLQFEEDVRPPYYGTYNGVDSPRSKKKLSRNPFGKERQDTNYDYESEAEWEPPEEGDEEIASDEEDEVDSQADADDEGFLDDEDDDAKSKRKIITGELVPTSTGLCWAGNTGRIKVVGGSEVDEQPVEMQGMRMGILLPGFSGLSIDPFSTTYWQNSTPQVPRDAPSCFTTMALPRQPLGPRTNNNVSLQPGLVGAAQGMKGPITTAVGATQPAKRGPKPAPKTLNKEDLDEFKNAVVGSDVGKLDLQKSLKARFPKMTNEVIKETLSSQFAQIGKTKAEKRWVYVGSA